MTALHVVDADHVGRTDGLLRSPEVCARAGCTYRQLDFWTRAGYLKPARAARGHGTQRLYTPDEADIARRMVHLSAAGLLPSAAVKAARGGDGGWLTEHVKVSVLD